MLLESLLTIVLAGAAWQTAGPELTQASAIVVGSDGTLYAIGPNGLPEPAIFRSVDRGESWEQIAAFPSRDYLPTIWADPLDPDRLFLVDEHIPMPLVFVDLYRSIDRGETWTSSLDTFGEGGLSAAFDPSRPNTLYVASSIFRRSDDGGDSFAQLDAPFSGAQLRVAPDGDIVAFTDDSLYRSQDRGDSWLSLPAPTGACGIFTELAIDPTNPERMFLAAGILSTNACGEVFRTLDGGQTWTRLADFGEFVTDILIDGFHPSLLYANTLVETYPFTGSVLASDDDGESWQDLALPATGASGIAMAEQGRRLYAATDAGVYARGFHRTRDANPRQ